ncbi:hypothetical protein K504DRAFT_452132 [Pleomassaria siparia CBS 279.74]|uniref:Uncharacterized protein n=1 Tax=Pleomassaria siparia CBS 279.74 TaxID=1314801 RepID=A0A6G1JQY6_9PLEO|nr:hypothetical protein K504DRAFT_452132 [Pleomassaria siparia CBS 279.74]
MAFFSVPGELRNKIYERGLVPFDKVIRYKEDMDPVRPPLTTRLCRQIRVGMMLIFYKQNSFILPQAIYTFESIKWFRMENRRYFEYKYKKQQEEPTLRNSPVGIVMKWLHHFGLE